MTRLPTFSSLFLSRTRVDFQTKSLLWGASPYYTKKIGNPTLRNINQNLRNTKFPYDNWRTADPGHIHYKWRLNDEDSWHWFR